MLRSVGQVRIHSDSWLVIHACEELGRYYRSQFNMRSKYLGFTIGDTKWGPHISVIRSEEEMDYEACKQFHETEVEFFFNPEFKTNGNHLWFDVSCEAIPQMRKTVGLNERIPDFGAHVTIGVYHKVSPEDEKRIWIPSHER